MHLRFLKRLSGKTPREQSSSGKKIGAESAVLHFVFFIVMVNKMQQSAKERCLLKRNTVPEVFPLTAGIAGSGKTMPFEKRRSRYKEIAENKAEAYRVYVEHLFSACDAVDARIFSKGEMDEETGLYYYGARYLDPKYSRWLSGDPALGDYIPTAGTDPSKLAGMGGVYNTVNLHLYHYAGNNPVKYTDPDGKSSDLTIILFPNNEMITELKTMQNQVLNDPKLKQGAGGPYDRTDSGIKPTTTWCNQATYQTTRVTDSTLAKAMYNKGDPNGDNTNAKSIYQNLKVAVQDANSPIMEVPPKTAQMLANVGISVVGVKDTNGIGHVATVAPGYKFDKTNGPMMANVGGSDKQGYTRAKSAFRQTYYADGKVHFYINKESLSNLKIVVIKE